MNRTQQQARTRRATLGRVRQLEQQWAAEDRLRAWTKAESLAQARTFLTKWQDRLTPAHLLTALEAEPHAWGGAPE